MSIQSSLLVRQLSSTTMPLGVFSGTAYPILSIIQVRENFAQLAATLLFLFLLNIVVEHLNQRIQADRLIEMIVHACVATTLLKLR